MEFLRPGERFIYMRAAWLSFLTLIALGCKDTNPVVDTLPYVYVNETVYLNEARAQPLNTRDGTFIYINGGLKGIVVYRQSLNNFVAVDRQSPAAGNCKVRVDPTVSYIVDSCSGSQFNFDGSYRTGSAPGPLRRYVTNCDGQRIVITNN